LVAVTMAVILWGVALPEQSHYDLCGFHWLTGRPCPLCGLTRALLALGKGHWKQAVQLHALSPLGLMMLFSLFWKNGPWRDWLWKTGLAAFGVYGVWRAALIS
jgi:hypothetical protein